MGNHHSRGNNNHWAPGSRSHEPQQQHQMLCGPASSSMATHGSQSQQSPQPTVLVTPQQPGAPSQPSRVVVDIRGANLDSSNYAVWVEKQPRRQRAQQAQRAAEATEFGVVFLSTTLQAVGGVLVTVLTIQKLLEELKLLRGLRRSNARSANSSSSRSSTHKAASSTAASSEAAFSLPRHLAEQLTHASPRTLSGPQDDSKSPGGTTRNSGQNPQSAWSSIAGLQHVKMLLQEVTVLPLVRPDLFSGVRNPPSAVLMYGPPGTGKTLLAKAVAAASGASFFAITGSSILSKWYGESEQNVRRLFEEATAAAPAVIFIDEVDSLLGKRSGAGAEGPGGAGEASRRVTNEFLAYIDGIATSSGPHSSSYHSSSSQAPSPTGRVVVIAATNAPWDLDEAALSRFAARLLVPLPDAAARQVILQDAMQGVSHKLDEAGFRRIAEQAEGYSGRDLIAVCREASMKPMRELWGGRILEGEAPRHCQQQQQLVAAVTTALQQGGNSRKLRRGLERWKRQTGATWCDVDQVLRAGEQAAQQGQQQQKQGLPGPQQRLPADGMQEQQQAAALQVCSAQPQAVQVCSQQPEQQSRPQLSPTQEDVSVQQRPCSLQQAAEATSSGCSDSACRMPGSQGLTNEQHHIGSGCASDKTSVRDASPLHDRHEEHNGANAAMPSSSKCCGGTTALSTPSKHSDPRPSAWTLEDLIALPSDAVRPVQAEDLQWALSQVGQVESLADKYEEWARKFGSGDGVHKAGRDTWRFMPMYL